MPRFLWLCSLIAALAAFAMPVSAQLRSSDERCPRLVAQETPRIIPAAFRLAALEPDQVRLTFIGHSTFLIESPRGVKIATDYNDYVRPRDDSRYRHHEPRAFDALHQQSRSLDQARAARLEPRRRACASRVHLRGRVGAQRRRPISATGAAAPTLHGNSIFVFELAGVCVAHLGHLHHTLTQEHLDQLGRIDVLLVPVDGSYTLGVDGMIEVLGQIKAPLMIPMHIFGPGTLERFLDKVGAIYEIERAEVPTLVVSRASLPKKPKMIVLPGR